MCTGRWEQRPVTEKYVTVVGEVEHPVTVRVPVGISIGEVDGHGRPGYGG